MDFAVPADHRVHIYLTVQKVHTKRKRKERADTFLDNWKN